MPNQHQAVPGEGFVAGRGEDYELRLALKPAYVLLLARDCRRIYKRDSRTRRPQDNHDVCALTPIFRRSTDYPRPHRGEKRAGRPCGERRR